MVEIVKEASSGDGKVNDLWMRMETGCINDWLPSEIINRMASIPTPREYYGMDMCVWPGSKSG